MNGNASSTSSIATARSNAARIAGQNAVSGRSTIGSIPSPEDLPANGPSLGRRDVGTERLDVAVPREQLVRKGLDRRVAVDVLEDDIELLERASTVRRELRFDDRSLEAVGVFPE